MLASSSSPETVLDPESQVADIGFTNVEIRSASFRVLLAGYFGLGHHSVGYSSTRISCIFLGQTV